MIFRVYVFCITIFILNATASFAQTLEVEGYTVDEEGYLTHSFAKFKKRKKQKLTLAVKNTGDQPLQLEALELSCDCLKAKKLPKLPIPVGASTKIRIIHKAKAIGPFDVFAKLKSNAKNHRELWIKLEGEVVKKP